MKKVVTAAMGFLALLSVACGGSSNNTSAFAGSCVSTGGDRCVEYTGTLWTEATGRSGCTGTFATTRCTTTNTIGSCVAGSASTQTTTYYFPPTTLATAQAACTTFSGTWRNP